MTDGAAPLHSSDMGWNRIAIATWLAGGVSACALDPKSLGEESTTGSDDDDDGDGSSEGDSDGGTEGGTEPPPPATELSAEMVDDVTPSGLSVAPDGSIYIVGQSGYTYEGGDGGSYASLWIGKLDPAGTLLWSMEPGPAYGFIGAASDGFALASVGYTEGRELQRFDADGNELWSVPLLDDGEDVIEQPEAVVVTAEGLVVVAGGSFHVDAGSGWAEAYDAAGTLQWEQLYGEPPGISTLKSAALTPDGGVVLGGRWGIAELSSQSQAFIAKIDATGATQWEQRITEGVATDEVSGLDVTADGTIHALVFDGNDRTVERFAPDGTAQSSSPSSLDQARRIAAGLDGSVVVTDGEWLPFEDPNACSAPWGTCPSAVRVARYELDGSVRWYDRRDDCNEGVDAAILADDRVLVVGACPPDIGASTVAMGLFVYAP